MSAAESEMIKIFLNDEEIEFRQGETLMELLRQISVDEVERIAIAVNDSVIRRSDWPSHRLNDCDRVLMIAPIQGG